MRAPSIDIRDVLMVADSDYFTGTKFNVGFDSSASHASGQVTIPDGITFLDIQGRKPELTIGGLHEGDQFPVVQVFYNAKQKYVRGKQVQEDYPASYQYGERVNSILHGYNSWRPVNGALYLCIFENTSTGYLEVSQQLSFPLLGTTYECHRKPFTIEDDRKSPTSVTFFSDLLSEVGDGSVYRYTYSKNGENEQTITPDDNGKLTINNLTSGDEVEYKATHKEGYYYTTKFTKK